jgi:hypothetical protein
VKRARKAIEERSDALQEQETQQQTLRTAITQKQEETRRVWADLRAQGEKVNVTGRFRRKGQVDDLQPPSPDLTEEKRPRRLRILPESICKVFPLPMPRPQYRRVPILCKGKAEDERYMLLGPKSATFLTWWGIKAQKEGMVANDTDLCVD